MSHFTTKEKSSECDNQYNACIIGSKGRTFIAVNLCTSTITKKEKSYKEVWNRRKVNDGGY